jgi:Dyp-type peroxidase family
MSTIMERTLDYDDIQGMVLRGYGRPEACYAFLRVHRADAGREFIRALARERVTSVRTWNDWEDMLGSGEHRVPHERRLARRLELQGERRIGVAWNVALSYPGLEALGLPQWSLSTFPPEFREGMRARAELLGDVARNGVDRWDDYWAQTPHIWVGLSALDQASLQGARDELRQRLAAVNDEVEQIGEQLGTALRHRGTPLHKEHFGFDDGAGQPDVEGAPPREGSPDWRPRPIRTGEFVLGHPDETLELPPAPTPPELAHNGTFMVYRKLHQNVFAFRRFLVEQARYFGGHWQLLAAKMLGRELDGRPLIRGDAVPPQRSNSFTYGGDKQGVQCPFGAHIRRTNPRDSLDPQGLTSSRHRIIRRGKPYGDQVPGMLNAEGRPPEDPEDLIRGLSAEVDREERGVIFMALNASISRQFEFVQREWVNAGSHVWQGRLTDPLIGNHGVSGRFMIPGRPQNGDHGVGGRDVTFVCAGIPQFVELRGGGYFFMPGRAALQLLGSGRIDREQ